MPESLTTRRSRYPILPAYTRPTRSPVLSTRMHPPDTSRQRAVRASSSRLRGSRGAHPRSPPGQRMFAVHSCSHAGSGRVRCPGLTRPPRRVRWCAVVHERAADRLRRTPRRVCDGLSVAEGARPVERRVTSFERFSERGCGARACDERTSTSPRRTRRSTRGVECSDPVFISTIMLCARRTA